MKSIAYRRPDLKNKNLNRLSMKNSNKLLNGHHIDDVMDNVTQRRLQEEFEDTKEVIRIRISKKNSLEQITRPSHKCTINKRIQKSLRYILGKWGDIVFRP